MSAPVCSIDYIATLYSCVNWFRPLVAAHLFPVHFQAVTLACTLASLVALYWHDLILWPQSDHRRRRCQSEFAAQLSLSVWLLGDIRVGYVASDRNRAPSALCSIYGTEAASSCLAADLWPLLRRQICMYMRHCGQRCQYQIARAVCTWQPGHWLAWPAHTICVYTVHHALAWIFHVRL